MIENPNSPDSQQVEERKTIWRTNIIMWVLILVIPIALFLGLERLAFATIPAGDIVVCERELGALEARITVEPFRMGQIYHERQLIEINRGEVWEPVIDMVLNLPELTPTCDTNLGNAQNLVWVWNGKTIALTNDEAISWQTWEICDEPRPDFGCVRDEYIQSTELSDDGLLVSVSAREGNYQVLTPDQGMNWQFVTSGETIDTESE
jgi:hypothetical protein